MTWRQAVGVGYVAALLVLAFAPLLIARRRGLRAQYQRHILFAQAICLTLLAVIVVLTAGPWDVSRWNSWIFGGYALALIAAMVEYWRAARAKRAAQAGASAPTV